MLKASILDLRYKMKEILQALDRNESIEILYHGKRKGILIPVNQKKFEIKITEHPYFGSLKENKKEVDTIMNNLRASRYDNI